MNQSVSHKVGRNDPCTCGSGKKYKACCANSNVAVNTPIGSLLDINSLLQQAQQAIAQADFKSAEALFRQLHQAKPTDAYFLASLGQALCWQNLRKSGVGYLLQAAKLLERKALKTRDPRLAQELSAQLLHWGEVNAAERLARLVVSLAPNAPAALNNLVLCLTRVNRNVEALPFAKKVADLLPNNPGCQILLALIEDKTQQTESALTRLEAVIAHNLDPEQTARAYLELGGLLDKLGRYDKAFIALTKASEAHSAFLIQHPAQREYLFEVLEQNTLGFTQDLLQRWTRAEIVVDNLPTPAFLMGFLRSGTTLTEQVLGAHPQIITTDESTIVHELVQELEALTGIKQNTAVAVKALTLADIQGLREFYWRRMQEEYGPEVMCKQLVDKNALNTMDLGVISVIFPEAKIIFAIRDPRDICLSCFMQAFSATPATVNLLSWSGIARQYAAVMGYWLAIRGLIQPTYLELRYEDTVTEFESTYRKVFEFLGLPWHVGVEQFHVRAKGKYISTPSFAQVSQPVYKKSVARWKHYESEFSTVIKDLQTYIKEFGYES